MNITVFKSIVLGGLVFASFSLMSFKSNAAEMTPSAKGLTSVAFYNKLEKAQPNQIANSFGLPDQIVPMRNASGDVTGVVWVYRDAVAKQDKKLDANFVLVNGVFKYVSLTNS